MRVFVDVLPLALLCGVLVAIGGAVSAVVIALLLGLFMAVAVGKFVVGGGHRRDVGGCFRGTRPL